MRTTLALSACLLAAAAVPLPAQEGGVDMVTRTFQVRYQEFEDAILIVNAVMEHNEGSENASVQLQRRLNRITVTDLPRVVEEVARALEEFDVPPRQVEVRMSLFLGHRGEPPEDEARDAVFHSVVDQLRRTLKYSRYELLGSLRVPVVEGEEASVTVGEGYTIRFTLGRVDAGHRLVRLDPLELSRPAAGAPDGSAERLLLTTLTLSTRKPLVSAVSSSPAADRALFLVIEAQIVG